MTATAPEVIPPEHVVALLTTHSCAVHPDPEHAVNAVEAVRDAAICAAAEDATLTPNELLDILDRHQPPDRLVIHTVSESDYATDWTLEMAVEFATLLGAKATWVSRPDGHNLQIKAADGRTIRFHVPGPDGLNPAATP